MAVHYIGLKKGQEMTINIAINVHNCDKYVYICYDDDDDECQYSWSWCSHDGLLTI